MSNGKIRIIGELPFGARVELVEADGRITPIPCTAFAFSVNAGIGRPNLTIDVPLIFADAQVALDRVEVRRVDTLAPRSAREEACLRLLEGIPTEAIEALADDSIESARKFVLRLAQDKGSPS